MSRRFVMSATAALLVLSGTGAARADVPVDANGPVPVGSSPVWAEDFSSPVVPGDRWTVDRTSAYAYGDHNPSDHKLDWIGADAVTEGNGTAVFTARPGTHTLENGQQAWTTGLLTTEGSREGFQVRTGDYIETRVRLPEAAGAWPALWTWRDGGNEVDSFEYHPDNPNLLELTNHVRSAGTYYSDPAAIAPGRWVTIGTRYGANSVDWYVNGVKVFSDGQGVGPSWSAYVILNLSVYSGPDHPGPAAANPITFDVGYVRVYRP